VKLHFLKDNKSNKKCKVELIPLPIVIGISGI